MAASTTQSVAGILAVSRTRVLIVLTLAITWFVASIAPHYRSQLEASFRSTLDDAKGKLPTAVVGWSSSDSATSGTTSAIVSVTTPSTTPGTTKGSEAPGTQTDVAQDLRNNYNTSKIALLIEPRPLPHLIPQLLHMISVVPPDWRFVFIGSNMSTVSVGRSPAVKLRQQIGKLDILELPEPWEIDSKEKVHRLLTDVRFYDEFLPGVEWILKYEFDSILCANSESSLNDWLHWDWAGAARHEDDRFSGNGGLSLRKVSTIKRVLKFQERLNDTQPEDEWFGTRVWTLPGTKVASGTDGQLAVEDTYIEKPMGFHVRDGGSDLPDAVWKDPAQRKKIFEYCPELTMIMDMKLERERCMSEVTDPELQGA